MTHEYLTRSERWAHKLDEFFERIAFLELDDEKKAQVAIETKRDNARSRLYWWQLVLSACIGIFGLLQGSVAVIIGAMLIAPFFGPIQACAYGIINGESKVIVRALWALFLSVVVTIIMGSVFSLAVGVSEQNPELLARTQPTIIDLLIALASGLVAFLSLRFERLSSSIAGVAMASALLPPLLVVGVELALNEYQLAWNAFFLFVTNLVAIVLTGMVMFLLYGYSAHVTRQLSTLKNSIIVLVIFILMLFPLVGSFVASSYQSSIQSDARQYLEEILTVEFEQHKIQSFDLMFAGDGYWHLDAEVILPEGEPIYIENKDAIESYLRNRLQHSIELDLLILRSVSLVSSQTIELDSAAEEMQTLPTLSEIKNSILAEMRLADSLDQEMSSRRDDYVRAFEQVWSEILMDAGLYLEHLRVDFDGMDHDSFDPTKIERVDFFVRAKGQFGVDSYRSIYTLLERRAGEIFPFSSTVQVELIPAFSSEFQIQP